MIKYLIVGKNGTLGSEYMRLLGSEAIGLDKSDFDITNQELVYQKIAELQPEVIINCAAYNEVDKAEVETDKANLLNGTAVGYLAAAAEKANAIFVHYSTNYVFKGDRQEGYKEDDQTDPQSAYGRSKLLGEKLALENCSKTYLIRTAWLYGQQGQGNSKINYVERIIQLSQEKDSLQGVNDQFGQPTWTNDLARFTLSLVESHQPYGIYHGTNSGEATWFSWAQEILKIKNIDIPISPALMADFPKSGHTANRPQYGLLLSTKFTPMRLWSEALKDYLTTNT